MKVLFFRVSSNNNNDGEETRPKDTNGKPPVEIEGDFKHGLPHGTVSWRAKSGHRFVGDFRMGKPHGRGALYDPSGRLVLTGKFLNGQPVSEDAASFFGDPEEGVPIEEFHYSHHHRH